MQMAGSANAANYTDNTWTLQKTGSFEAGVTAGVGTVNWSVAVTKVANGNHFALIGYFDLINGTTGSVPIRGLVVNLQKFVGGDFATASSDIADSTLGDAATQANVDPDFTYEYLSSFQENSASGPLTILDSSLNPISLNGSPQSVPAGQTVRYYFIASFDGAQLSLSPGTSLQVEVIVNFPTNFVFPSLSTLTSVTVPNPTVANDTTSLSDPSITASGTVTTGTFTPITQILSGGSQVPASVTVDGGTNGGTVCNTAYLTSPSTTIPIVIDGVSIPVIVIPGVNLTASDCQPVPKVPGGPVPTTTVINTCSQVVTYDASLFTSPSGSIVSASFNPASGSTFPFGTSTVNYSVTDSAGNTATGTLTVNVIDSEAPHITPVSDITVPTDNASCAAVVRYSTDATDCNLASLTFSPASGSSFPIGKTTVTITATDTAGHTSTSTFSVTVVDNRPPLITTSNIQATASGTTCGANVAFAASALDCTTTTIIYSLSPTFDSTIASGANFPVGTTTVYVRATDAYGNVAVSSFTVTVTDTSAPVISAPNIVVGNDDDICGAAVTFNATATDCSAVTLVYALDCNFLHPVTSGTVFPVGTTTVYVKATDSSGNVSKTSFTVKVKDTQPPTITSPLTNITLQPDSCTCYATFCYKPTAVDNCGGCVSVTVSPACGSHFAAGTTTTVTVTATDSAGNSVTKTFTVTVGKCQIKQTTYTQGGWGATPHGNNPGTLLWKYFCSVYPNGLVVGGKYTCTFTSASAITNALPLGGTPAVLTKNLKNPTSGNTFLSQTVALKLNVDFSARGYLPLNQSALGNMKLTTGEMAGYTVNQVLSIANKVLGGQTSYLPSGVTVSDLCDIEAAINGNFDNGTTNNGYLSY